MGKPFVRSQPEMAKNWQRDSLEILGQASELFSKAPGSAWDDALRYAEQLLQEKSITLGRPSNPSKVPGSAWEDALKAAEELLLQEEFFPSGTPSNASTTAEKVSVKNPASENPHRVEKNYFEYHGRGGSSSDGFDSSSYGYDRGSRRSSESRSEVSAVSEDFVKERADQWGYRVPLKSTRDSTPRTSGGSLTPARSPGGTPAIPAVSQDVKDALSSFMLAFMVCDATKDDFPILFSSPGFTTMTGYSGDEIIGKNCTFLRGDGTDRVEIAKILDALKNGEIYTGTVLNYKKDGTPFWNLLTLSPIKDENGTVIKYIGMQAEQNSKEKQPRNSKRQKSSNGVPRPPGAPRKTSPNASAELEDQSRRTSQRYSLSSAPARSRRQSSVDEFHQPITRRESALKVRDVTDGAKTSSVDASRETSAKVDSRDGEKSRSNRLSSRFRRLFSKDSKELKRQVGQTVIDFLGSDDEDDFSQDSGRTSEISSRSAGGYSTSQLRLESSSDELSEKLREIDIVGQQNHSSSSSSRSAYDETKQQFCIVEQPSPSFYDKQQFCIVES